MYVEFCPVFAFIETIILFCFFSLWTWYITLIVLNQWGMLSQIFFPVQSLSLPHLVKSREKFIQVYATSLCVSSSLELYNLMPAYSWPLVKYFSWNLFSHLYAKPIFILCCVIGGSVVMPHLTMEVSIFPKTSDLLIVL